MAKTLQEWEELKIALERDYKTIANSELQYEPATIAYAKKCMEDARKSYQEAKNDQTQE